jgi:phosphoribosylanthranilate isomerase
MSLPASNDAPVVGVRDGVVTISDRDGVSAATLAPLQHASEQGVARTASDTAAWSPHVKICGLTNAADAELALELGAWALGMVFYDASPRRCSLEAARDIATLARRKAEVWGVFVNAPLDRVVASAQELELTTVQLHGDEGPVYCSAVASRTGARVCKAAQVASIGDVRDVERFHVDFHLLDTRVRENARAGLRGGTGESFDWSLLAARRSRVPLVLSGGLQPGNVSAAIRAAAPFAVDVASGTEAAPGHKDPERMRAFFEAARSASRSGSRA